MSLTRRSLLLAGAAASVATGFPAIINLAKALPISMGGSLTVAAFAGEIAWSGFMPEAINEMLWRKLEEIDDSTSFRPEDQSYVDTWHTASPEQERAVATFFARSVIYEVATEALRRAGGRYIESAHALENEPDIVRAGKICLYEAWEAMQNVTKLERSTGRNEPDMDHPVHRAWLVCHHAGHVVTYMMSERQQAVHASGRHAAWALREALIPLEEGEEWDHNNDDVAAIALKSWNMFQTACNIANGAPPPLIGPVEGGNVAYRNRSRLTFNDVGRPFFGDPTQKSAN